MLLSAVVDSLTPPRPRATPCPSAEVPPIRGCRVRSGLIRVQVSPRSSIVHESLAQYSRRGECGLTMHGASQFARLPAPRPRRLARGPPGAIAARRIAALRAAASRPRPASERIRAGVRHRWPRNPRPDRTHLPGSEIEPRAGCRPANSHRRVRDHPGRCESESRRRCRR